MPGDEIQRRGLLNHLTATLPAFGFDELRVVAEIVTRLSIGRQQYGELDLSKPRDWRRERFEERCDALVYDVCEELALEDRESALKREAERREMVGEFSTDQHATRIGGPEPYESVEIQLEDLGGEGGW